ncbi:MAG: L-serine ammonia-lyase, iron-sulfur-dependent, subunit alpha [Bacillota bacterium]|nr:L-serine ammonia-lyase, iron-sulfur-dependent, subunit alpha [Bacillota bacterium]
MKYDFTGLLKKELKPALGVTEVGAIALAAARAYDAVGGSLLHIQMVMNGGMYKNAFSCAIPGTEEIGCEMAAALGALGGDWKLGLEVLKGITPNHVAQAKALSIPIEIKVDETKESIYILAEITTTKGVGLCRIEDFHANIVFVAQDDTVLFEAEKAAAAEAKAEEIDFDSITVADMVEYAKTVPVEELACIRDMIEMNVQLSQEGEKGVGLGIWKTLAAFQNKGAVGNDMIYAAQKLTCSAMDARLAGLPHAAMSIVGSGSHGILCSLPVVSYGRYMEKSEEEILRAVALSGLVTIFSKHYTGRLSSLCGCVLGGGSGAASGIVYLMGGGAKEVSAAMDHMAANLTGMICDGGSTGCALKASAGVYSSYLSAMLAMEGVEIPHNFGVIGSSAEQTERNLGRISDEGMAPMDTTIISIMQKGL